LVTFIEDGRLAHGEDGEKPELYKLDTDGRKMDGVYVGMRGRVRWGFKRHVGLGAGSFFGLRCNCWNSKKAREREKRMDF
jgi:hypothetical protein